MYLKDLLYVHDMKHVLWTFGFLQFYLLVKTGADDSCNSLVATETVQYIVSHSSYGREDYTVRTDICWRIFAQNGSFVVQLDEKDFSLEYGGSTCIYDYLVIYDGPTLSSTQEGTYCGTRGPGTVYSTQSYMTLMFKSDATFNDKGFRLSYNRIHKNDVPSSSNQITTGALIGIIFCVFVVITIIGAFTILCLKNKYRKVHAARSVSHTNRSQRHGIRPNRSGTIAYGNGNEHITQNSQPVAPPPYQESLPANTQSNNRNVVTSSFINSPPPAYSEPKEADDVYAGPYPTSPPPAYCE